MAGIAQKIDIGDVSAYGLGKPAHPPTYDTRRGKIHVIDIGTLDQIKAGNITVLPGIERINAKTVTFTDSRELPFDAIVLATGYRPALADVLGATLAGKALNEKGFPKNLWIEEKSVRGLYFLGYKNPLTGVF